MKVGTKLQKRRYPEGETIAKAFAEDMVGLNMLKGISVYVGLPEDALPWLTAINNQWFATGDKKSGVLKPSRLLGPLEAQGYVKTKPVAGTRSRMVDITGVDEKISALLKDFAPDRKMLERHWGKDKLAEAKKNFATAPLLEPETAVCPSCEGEVSAEEVEPSVWRPWCAACELHGKPAPNAMAALDPWRAKVLGEKKRA